VPLIKLEGFENVGNGKTALCSTTRLWPVTLEYIALVLGGTFTKAHISQIKVKFGTKVVWDITGSQLSSMNLFEVRPATATVLTLPFFNYRARDLEQMYIPAPDFGAIGVRKVDIEVSVSGATDPITLDAWASVAPPKLLTPAQNLLFRAFFRQQLAPSAAVTDQPQQLNYGQAGGALLRRMHFFSALVTKLKIKRDGLDFYEDVALALNNALLDEQGWDPQASIFTFNAIADDNELKALTSVRDDGAGGSLVPQQILMTTSGAGAFDVVSDTIIGLNGIA
jgi:hypothetical protein